MNDFKDTETEFFRTQQGHVDNIPSGFQLSVHLQFHLSAEWTWIWNVSLIRSTIANSYKYYRKG